MTRGRFYLHYAMTIEIIMCDYNHVDYNPKTDDDLLSLATSVKSRKKVTRLLTRGIEQQTADLKSLIDTSRLYHPDDDKEEREERRKLARERLKAGMQRATHSVRTQEKKIEERKRKEILRQCNDLSIPVDKELAKLERYIEVNLGLAIAAITAYYAIP
ncbi:MAG: hypothetical protein WBE61_03765 [Nitrososphaeraceae archaeon]